MKFNLYKLFYSIKFVFEIVTSFSCLKLVHKIEPLGMKFIFEIGPLYSLRIKLASEIAPLRIKLTSEIEPLRMKLVYYQISEEQTLKER